jgi:hypothetical protein
MCWIACGGGTLAEEFENLCSSALSTLETSVYFDYTTYMAQYARRLSPSWTGCPLYRVVF